MPSNEMLIINTAVGRWTNPKKNLCNLPRGRLDILLAPFGHDGVTARNDHQS